MKPAANSTGHQCLLDNLGIQHRLMQANLDAYRELYGAVEVVRELEKQLLFISDLIASLQSLNR